MDVAITELRAQLGAWIAEASAGNEVVITDRGTPVAKIIGLNSTPTLERLTKRGIISRPSQTVRPVAGGRHRPTPKRPVAEIIEEQRR